MELNTGANAGLANVPTNLKSWDEAIDHYPLLQYSDSYNKHRARHGKSILDAISPKSIYRKLRKRERSQNPIAAGMADIVPWILYDRINVANGATTAIRYQLFTVPDGSGGKTERDTNMTEVGKLPAPQWFNCIGIGFYPSSTALKADIDELLNDYTQTFWIGKKDYSQGPLFAFPGASGLYGLTTQTTQSAFTIGHSMAGNYYDLRLPAGMTLGVDSDGQQIVTDGITGHTILQNQNFQVNLNADAGFVVASNPLYFYCLLFGILSRGVQ